VRGCEFREAKQHIFLGEAVRRAVITGNLFTGPARIQVNTHGDVQAGFNAAS
jgi:hypothetical protein